MPAMPRTGTPKEEILAALDAYRARDVRWREGGVFAHVYDAGREVEEVAREAYVRYLTSNGLDPTAFPSLRRLEVEVVAMAAAHLGGDGRTAGSFTSGGTESILLAVKAARDGALRARPELRGARLEIVAPVTAHAAFHKAAHYLGLDLVTTEVDPRTFTADPGAMRAAITPRTVLLVGSAPSWPHGAIDPIPELGRIALEAGVRLHVDACVGGFLLPYFRRLGATVPEFDLRVPGVTSISMDLHKYAFVPKGASVILHRDRALRRPQLFGCARWPGYIVVNPTVQSSKSGGPVAAAWAVMRFLGDEGYLELARRTLEGARRLRRGIEGIPGLRILGEPAFAVLAAASERASVFHVVDEMKARGWELQAQLAFGASPANIHFIVTPGNAHRVDAMTADLATVVAAAPARGAAVENVARGAATADLLATRGAGPIDDAELGRLLALVGASGGRIPERLAEVQELLDALPPELRGELVTAFFDELYMPGDGDAP